MQSKKLFNEQGTNSNRNNYRQYNQVNNSINNSNKAIFNLNTIINNLKISLEKFDSSILELKLDIDKDKEEKNQKIQELEDTLNSKLNSLKNSQTIDEYKIKNNSPISKEKFNEIISKINILEKKSEKMESDFYNQLSNYNNINKNSFNEIMKKFNEKNQRDSYSSRTYKREEDSALGKNIDNLIKQKIDRVFDIKMKMFDEKIQILNSKVINLEVKSQRNDNSINRESIFSDVIISDKLDKKIQILTNNINNKLVKLGNQLGIDNLEEIGLDDLNQNKDDENNNEINEDNKEVDSKIMNEINNKMKLIYDDIYNKLKNYIDNKFNDIKNEISSSKNRTNDKSNEDDINNKLSSLKSELSKIVDSKNNYFETKIKNINNKSNQFINENQLCVDKLNSLDSKIKIINNRLRLMENKNENISSDPMVNNSSIIPNSKNILNEDSSRKSSNKNLSTNFKPDKSFDLDSIILNKEDITEDFFLFSKIKEVFPYDMKIKYKLIYRCSKHGDTAKNFHLKCDYIGPNIVLIKTKKNFIFGGVTSKSWKHLLKDIKKDEPEYGTEVKDEKAFGFSLNLKKIYKNGKPNEFAIFCNNNYGPVFKNNYFKIFNECLKNGGICGKIEESNFIGQEKNYEFNGEEEKFEVEDIEVFQIGFK